MASQETESSRKREEESEEGSLRIMCAFVAGFEVFRKRIITQVQALLADGIDDHARPVVSAQYRNLIYPAQVDELEACLKWLHKLGCLSQTDMGELAKLRNYRSEIGHRMLQWVGTDSIATYRAGLDDLSGILKNVEDWWAQEVRPPNDTESVSARAHTKIHMHRSILSLKTLGKFARGDDDAVRKYYGEFLLQTLE